MLTRRLFLSLSVALTLTVFALALSGCGMSPFSAASSAAQSTTAPAVQPGHFAGIAHGGQQPVAGATVALWAAGTTVGYGQGATLVATTTTDANGGFNLDTTGTTSPCTTGQYNYITITGGNPGAGTNSASALLLALPQPCNANTGGLYVMVNEPTTVASVWALQQFMSITPANVSAYASSPSAANAPWMIGAPSTNTTGLANAFSTVSQFINNLATSYLGNSVVASNVTGGNAASTFYTLIFPDYNRAYVVANILASCVNTTNTSGNTDSTVCPNLFNAVSPSGAVLPADTIQAAYDIATAPGGITAYPRAGTSGTVLAGTALNTPTGGCATTGCTWAYNLCTAFSTPTPSFAATACTNPANGTATYPGDFLIGVRWQAYDNAGRLYGVYNGDVAVDSNGNSWTAATKTVATSTGYPLVEWDPQGHVLQAIGGNYTMPSSAVNVAMVNASGYYVATAAFSYTTPPTVNVAPAVSVAPFSTLGIAVDTNNNIWVPVFGIIPTGYALTNGTNTFNSGLLLEAPSATVTNSNGTPTAAPFGTVTAVASTGSVATISTTATYNVGASVELFGFKTDTVLNGQVYQVQSVGTGNFTINSTVSNTTDTGYVIPAIVHATTTAGTVTPYITGYTPGPIAIDNNNNIWLESRGTSTAAYNPLTLMTASSGYTTIYENQYETSAGQNVVVDGLGFAWATSNQTATGKFIARSTVSSSQTTTTASNAGFNQWNISGTNYASGSIPIAPHYLALDNYGNTWVAENTSSGTGSIVYFAVPGGPASAFSPLPAADELYHESSTNSSSTAPNAYTGGLTDPDVISLDGLGNIWTGNSISSGGAGISEFVVTGATGGTGGTISPVSPTNIGNMSTFGFNDYTTNTPQSETIDGSGNLNIGGIGSYVVRMIGAAAPVVTPIAKAAAPVNTTITAWSIGSSTATATFTATNSFAVGQKVLLSGFTTTTAFNGQLVGVTASTGSTFTATLFSATGLTANTSNTENGVVTASNVASRP